MDWQISQFFGDKSSMDKSCDEDIVSAIAFNREGTHLCLGDKAGRLILFSEKESRKASTTQFQYFTELQSHIQDFDPLKSQTVPEQINAIEWLEGHGKSLYVLSTNDKIIKLWKMSEKVIKKVVKASDRDLSMPVLQKVEETIYPSLHKCFPSLHTTKIKAISASRNEEFLLSAEEEKVLLWSVEAPTKAFIIYDLNRPGLTDIKESVSSCCFHPTHDNVFLLATSMRSLRVVDTRVRVTNPEVVSFGYPPGGKNFFSEMIEAYHDARFFPNATHLAARDALSVRVWDMRVPESPLSCTPINSHIKGKLC
jgi:serine/threonine-protein phosphatase 2A regulatory subunit B